MFDDREAREGLPTFVSGTLPSGAFVNSRAVPLTLNDDRLRATPPGRRQAVKAAAAQRWRDTRQP